MIEVPVRFLLLIHGRLQSALNNFSSLNDCVLIKFCYVQLLLLSTGGLIPGGAVLIFTLELLEVKGDYV